jgi:hypothetical protein
MCQRAGHLSRSALHLHAGVLVSNLGRGSISERAQGWRHGQASITSFQIPSQFIIYQSCCHSIQCIVLWSKTQAQTAALNGDVGFSQSMAAGTSTTRIQSLSCEMAMGRGRNGELVCLETELQHRTEARNVRRHQDFKCSPLQCNASACMYSCINTEHFIIHAHFWVGKCRSANF